MSLADGLCWWLTAVTRELLVQGAPPVVVDQVDGDHMLVELHTGDTLLLPRPLGFDPTEGERLRPGPTGFVRERDATPTAAVARPASPTTVDLPAEIDLTLDLGPRPGAPGPAATAKPAAPSKPAAASKPAATATPAAASKPTGPLTLSAPSPSSPSSPPPACRGAAVACSPVASPSTPPSPRTSP